VEAEDFSTGCPRRPLAAGQLDTRRAASYIWAGRDSLRPALKWGPNQIDRQEDRSRQIRIAWLGIILLVGFLMPVVVERGWPRRPALYFPNFELAEDVHLPGFVEFLAFYPALGGAAVTFFAFAGGKVLRSLGLIATGAIPFVVFAFADSVHAGLPATMRAGAASFGWVMLFAYIASAGVFVASRSVYYRERSLVGTALGAAGGAFYLVCLLASVGPGQSWTALGFGAVVRPMLQDETFLLGVCVVTQMACLVGASLICIAGFCLRRRRSPTTTMKWAFGFLVASIIACTLGVLAQILPAIPAHLRGYAVLTGISLIAKLSACILGSLLVLPVGLADLAVNVTDIRRARTTRRDGREGTL